MLARRGYHRQRGNRIASGRWLRISKCSAALTSVYCSCDSGEGALIVQEVNGSRLFPPVFLCRPIRWAQGSLHRAVLIFMIVLCNISVQRKHGDVLIHGRSRHNFKSLVCLNLIFILNVNIWIYINKAYFLIFSRLKGVFFIQGWWLRFWNATVVFVFAVELVSYIAILHHPEQAFLKKLLFLFYAYSNVEAR